MTAQNSYLVRTEDTFWMLVIKRELESPAFLLSLIPLP